MLQGITDLLPTAEVGFLGIKRDEETLEPHTYANRLPDDLTGRQVYIIDPMLATGGSIDLVARRLQKWGVDPTTVDLDDESTSKLVRGDLSGLANGLGTSGAAG